MFFRIRNNRLVFGYVRLFFKQINVYPILHVAYVKFHSLSTENNTSMIFTVMKKVFYKRYTFGISVLGYVELCLGVQFVFFNNCANCIPVCCDEFRTITFFYF